MVSEFEPGDAQQLKDNPVLRAAFASLEKQLMDEAVYADSTDDDSRYRAVVGIQILRYIQRHLDKVIFDGKRNVVKMASNVVKGTDSWT